MPFTGPLSQALLPHCAQHLVRLVIAWRAAASAAVVNGIRQDVSCLSEPMPRLGLPPQSHRSVRWCRGHGLTQTTSNLCDTLVRRMNGVAVSSIFAQWAILGSSHSGDFPTLIGRRCCVLPMCVDVARCQDGTYNDELHTSRQVSAPLHQGRCARHGVTRHARSRHPC